MSLNMQNSFFRLKFYVLLLVLVLFSGTCNAFDLRSGLKENVRKAFASIASKPAAAEFGKLPPGLTIIEGDGYRGIKIVQGQLEIRVHTWKDDTGLLENFNKAKEEGHEVVAAINGTFYASRGALGQLVSDAALPDVRQVPGYLSRCFLSSFRAMKNRQFWYIGETSLQKGDLLRFAFKEKAWFNVPEIYDGIIDNLIGGGGWILRNRRDVHQESYERQRFRFRHSDKTARKTVIAQDSNRDLYFIVFDDGFTFHRVARTLVKDDVFSLVREAFFLDGGSSSAIVLNGKYLVPPLLVIDKARFSCIQVLLPVTPW